MWGYGDAVAGIGDEKKAGEEPAEGVPLEVVRRGLVTKPETYWDNSNSQFAVLGLHSAVHSGIKIPREVWERVEKHFHEKQVADVGTSGGWSYQNFGVNGSMTCAGLASLVVARHHLGLDKSAPDPAVVKGLEWLAGHFTVEENPGYNSVSAPHDQYYYLYGLERVGVLAGTEFLGDHEWYPAGARYLLAHQAADGSWLSAKSPPTADDEGRKRYLDTCYAILFLRRATLSLTGMVPPRPAPMVEKPKPSTLAVRYQGKGLPPVLVPAMELVLDCSGSMKDPVEGEPKYLVARRIMHQAVDELPTDFQVGLRVFGHMGFWGNNPGQPADDDPRWNTDSEMKISIGSLVDAKNRRKLIKDWIELRQAGRRDAAGVFLAPGQGGPVGGLARTQDGQRGHRRHGDLRGQAGRRGRRLQEWGDGAGGEHRWLWGAGGRGKTAQGNCPPCRGQVLRRPHRPPTGRRSPGGGQNRLYGYGREEQRRSGPWSGQRQALVHQAGAVPGSPHGNQIAPGCHRASSCARNGADSRQ